MQITPCLDSSFYMLDALLLRAARERGESTTCVVCDQEIDGLYGFVIEEGAMIRLHGRCSDRYPTTHPLKERTP